MRGGAQIMLRGRMNFDARGARRLDGFNQFAWQAQMRATVSWKRCPRTARKSLRGKPCHITARWTGNKLLVDALGV